MKVKTLLKVLAISMVLILITISSYAGKITTTSNKGSIIVSDIESGVNVSAYKLTTVEYDYINEAPKDVPYTWETEVQNWITEKYPNYSEPEEFYKAFYNEEISTTAQATDFYSELASAIKGGVITLEAKTEVATEIASNPGTENKLNGSVTFTDCEMGTYLILIENGYMVYTPSVVNLTPKFNDTSKVWELAETVEVNVKSTKPQIKKTVTDEDMQKDNYSTGDTITYTIVADVPNYEKGSLAKTFKITDDLNGGLNLNENSIEVYGVNGVNSILLTKGETEEYTLESSEDSFTINFDYDKISGFEKIKVVYIATLNKSSSTILGSSGNINTATLTYSNNPYIASSTQIQRSENTVYTYGIEITKVDKTEISTTLTGAKFTLSSGNSDLYFIKNADGIYYKANNTDANATTDLEVNSSGKLCLYGLDSDTYSLKETKAPNGYNVAKNPVSIQIIDEDLNGALDATADKAEDSTGIYKLTFPNSKGFQLPVTGGAGTVAFVASGIVFVGLGIILLVIVLKKSYSKK